MIFTLGYAKTALARFVDGALTPGSTAATDAINEAIMRILMIEDWALTLQRMRFFAAGDLLVLPAFGERIVAARPDLSLANSQGRNVGHVWGRTYEFIDGGPLGAQTDSYGLRDLIDLGDGYPTIFDPDRVTTGKLAAFSTEQDDAGLLLHIRGYTPEQREVLTAGASGISLAINRWKDGVEGDVTSETLTTSTMKFTDITHLVKPATKGHVHLFSVADDSSMRFLGIYGPKETVPGFHRYRIRNPDTTNGTAWTCLVKMRYIPATSDNDPLLVQNVPAIKMMLLAMRSEDQELMDKKIAFTKDCMWWLGQQKKQVEPTDGTFSVEDSYGMGDIGEN